MLSAVGCGRFGVGCLPVIVVHGTGVVEGNAEAIIIVVGSGVAISALSCTKHVWYSEHGRYH